MVPANQPIKATFSQNPNAFQYVKKQYFQNLFSIEPNRTCYKLLSLELPEHNGKYLNYYSAILFQEKLVFIKSILEKIDKSKMIYHSVFILNIVTKEKWGLRPTSTKPLLGLAIPFSYYEYIHAWFKFMLHQDATITHSWFVKFDKDLNSQLPLWFIS